LSQIANFQLLMMSGGDRHNGQSFMFASAVFVLRMKACHSDYRLSLSDTATLQYNN